MDEPFATFVLLGRVGDPTHARLLAARLQSEGIEVRVRTEASGPYPFTVGDMAIAELWVTDDQLGDAREVMLAAEVDDTLGRVESSRDPLPPWSWSARLLALALALVMIGLFIRRFIILLNG